MRPLRVVPKSRIRGVRTQDRAAALRAFKGQRAIAAQRGVHALEHVAPAPARQVKLALVAAAVGARSLGYRKRPVGRPERLRARLLRAVRVWG